MQFLISNHSVICQSIRNKTANLFRKQFATKWRYW